MTKTFTYPLDPRRQIEALVGRQQLAARLMGRRDIVGHGALLRDALLSSGAERKTRLEDLARRLPSDLPGAEEIAAQLVKQVEFDGRLPVPGAAVPAGVRFPTLKFSVPLQMAAAQSDDGKVAGVAIWRLPVTRSELLCHLYSSIGLICSPTVGSLALAEQDAIELGGSLGEAFYGRFGFAIEDVVERLLVLLDEDPDLYILALSREQELVAPKLAGEPPLTPHKALGRGVDIMKALETLWELKRAAVMTWALRQWNAVTFYDVRDFAPASVSNDENTKSAANFDDTSIFEPGSGLAPLAEAIMMQAAALRRFLRQRPDERLPLDLKSLHDAVSSRSLGWNQAEWAHTDKGLKDILTALAEQANMLRRVKGKGFGHHAEPLDTFCGISAYQLPLLAVAEIGRGLTGRSDDLLTNELGAAMHKVLLGNVARHGTGSPEHARRQARKFGRSYLPAIGRMGAAGRFDPSLWGRRYRDEPFYRRLANYVYDPRQHSLRSRNPMVRRIGLALLFMIRRFQKLYAPTRVTADMIRITCDLATSVCVLTTDPVFKALLNKTEKIDVWFRSAPMRAKAK